MLMDADLSELDLVALLIDGVHFAEHLCVVALAITIDGTKIPLGLVEGSTENTTVVTDLLAGLRERGLDVTRRILVVIDGAKALAAAVRAVFRHSPVIWNVHIPAPPGRCGRVSSRHSPSTASACHRHSRVRCGPRTRSSR